MEEKLREAACFGDLDGLQALLKQGADINGQHLINGWTALHWAAKRNNAQCVQILLANGANTKLKNSKGEVPFQLTSNDGLRNLLGGHSEFSTTLERKKHGSFVPNYLRNPQLNYRVEVDQTNNGDLTPTKREQQQLHQQKMAAMTRPVSAPKKAVKILKVRLTGHPHFDPDFIEIDLLEETLTFRRLVESICEEFSIDPKTIVKLRKLPNTKLRRDIEVQRMENYQEVEAEIAELET